MRARRVAGPARHQDVALAPTTLRHGHGSEPERRLGRKSRNVTAAGQSDIATLATRAMIPNSVRKWEGGTDKGWEVSVRKVVERGP